MSRLLSLLLIGLAVWLAVTKWQDNVAERLAANEGSEPKTTCKISYVYDGDTVKIDCGQGAEKARLIGFDTPETMRASCPEEEAHGQKAKARLEDLIDRAKTIDGDRKGRDKYNRALYEVRLDGVDVKETLISEGLAAPYGWGGKINWCDKLKGGT